ncbi:unnamed protein product [Mytilus edulis]|uniref:Uncharacterized protein n=1 Tax=Mytilus edulis TaxID=6550 RepID=A0A8S3T063_MYTED|nr:unnamed protein product [Mytilus edulis]
MTPQKINDHVFKPCTEGDGIKISVYHVPSDRPVSIELFDSSKFHDPPVLSVCKNPAEKCTCKSDEAEIVNQGECNKTLKPSCRCKTKAGYFGTDPDLLSVVPRPTGNVETTTAKPTKKEARPSLTPNLTRIIILSSVLPVLFLMIVLFIIGLCWYCRKKQNKRKTYAHLQTKDPEHKKNNLNQENSGYLRNSQSSSIVDMSKYSKRHYVENTEECLSNLQSRLNAATSDRSCQFCSEKFAETDWTNNTIEKDLENQVDHTSDLNSTCLGDRCEPDGKEADTMVKKDTKCEEINHQTYPMCKESNPQVKETEGKPMLKEIESLLNSAPQSSNLGLGTQLPSPGMAELDDQPPLSLATFDE